MAVAQALAGRGRCVPAGWTLTESIEGRFGGPEHAPERRARLRSCEVLVRLTARDSVAALLAVGLRYEEEEEERASKRGFTAAPEHPSNDPYLAFAATRPGMAVAAGLQRLFTVRTFGVRAGGRMCAQTFVAIPELRSSAITEVREQRAACLHLLGDSTAVDSLWELARAVPILSSRWRYLDDLHWMARVERLRLVDTAKSMPGPGIRPAKLLLLYDSLRPPIDTAAAKRAGGAAVVHTSRWAAEEIAQLGLEAGDRRLHPARVYDRYLVGVYRNAWHSARALNAMPRPGSPLVLHQDYALWGNFARALAIEGDTTLAVRAMLTARELAHYRDVDVEPWRESHWPTAIETVLLQNPTLRPFTIPGPGTTSIIGSP